MLQIYMIEINKKIKLNKKGMRQKQYNIRPVNNPDFCVLRNFRPSFTDSFENSRKHLVLEN